MGQAGNLASQEAIRRQEAEILLGENLRLGSSALEAKKYSDASMYYEAALDNSQVVGSGAAEQGQAAIAGLRRLLLHFRPGRGRHRRQRCIVEAGQDELRLACHRIGRAARDDRDNRATGEPFDEAAS